MPLFDEVARAAQNGLFFDALRLADRARRTAPVDPACIMLHARLLLLNGFVAEAFERLQDSDLPEAKVLLGDICCQLGQWKRASEICGELLQGFAVDKIEGLDRLASRICSSGIGVSPGWVGTDGSLKLVGEVLSSISISIPPDCAGNPAMRVRQDSSALDSFSTAGIASSILVTDLGQGGPLIGATSAWPPDFKVSGWVALERCRLIGEVRFDWAPDTKIHLAIGPAESPHHRVALVKPEKGASGGANFTYPLNRWEQEMPLVQVSVILPDGSRTPLLGSPVTVKGARTPVPIQRRSVRSAGSQTVDPIVDIIIPVYKGYEETLLCVRSVISTTDPSRAAVIVINDASPDSSLSGAIEKMSAESPIRGGFTLLVNKSNLGFAGTVNRGLRLHPERDVVLLNSDTEVSGDWLARLRLIASQSDDIGTVTPLSEAGSVTDYKRSSEDKAITAAEVDRIASEVNAGQSAELPVGVGLCLYIRRSCIRETGDLDESAFPKGYGEETDFCLRARALGWRHMAAPTVFVKHRGGLSFGGVAQPLRRRSERVLNYLHPGYDNLVSDFLASDPLLAQRRAIDMRRLREEARTPVLLVTLNLPGGVWRHVEERVEVLSAAGHTIIVIQPDPGELEPGTVVLNVRSLGLDNLIFRLPGDADVLRDLLEDLHVSSTEIHHFLGLPPELLEIVLSLAASYDIYVHDYAWICPRVTLIGGSGVYCGEPALKNCENCIQAHGSAMQESLTVASLRARSGRMLAGAQRVIVPSPDARARLLRYFPDLHMGITPWEQDSDSISRPPEPALISPGRPLSARTRVAVIGAIGVHKGYEVLLECARDAAERKLDLEFSVIGYTADDEPLLDTGRVFITGFYAEAEADELLDRENCRIAFIPSVWPETWCYSLSYALRRGMPVLAFDMGAQADRLRDSTASVVLPLSTAPQQINEMFLQMDRRLIAREQEMETSRHNEAAAGNKESRPSGSEPPSSTVQILTLPSGVYSFTVKGAAPTETSDGLSLPALQVSMAPMRSNSTVEFLTGASHMDRWLARDTDMIVIKISGGPASMLLTSLRQSDSPVLAVDVQRLNAEVETEAVILHDGYSISEPAEPEIEVLTHIRNVGDVQFRDGWAGWLGQQLWIEAFAISTLGNLAASLVEYRGLAANGMDTGWLSGPVLCGARGTGAPMLGFAVRLRPELADQFDCEYSARFLSGAMVGPLHDGTLCISRTADDPMEGMQVQVIKRPEVSGLASVPAENNFLETISNSAKADG